MPATQQALLGTKGSAHAAEYPCSDREGRRTGRELQPGATELDRLSGATSTVPPGLRPLSRRLLRRLRGPLDQNCISRSRAAGARRRRANPGPAWTLPHDRRRRQSRRRGVGASRRRSLSSLGGPHRWRPHRRPGDRAARCVAPDRSHRRGIAHEVSVGVLNSSAVTQLRSSWRSRAGKMSLPPEVARREPWPGARAGRRSDRTPRRTARVLTTPSTT